MDINEALRICGTFPGFSLCKSEHSQSWEATYWPDDSTGFVVLGSDDDPVLAIYEFVNRVRKNETVPVAI